MENWKIVLKNNIDDIDLGDATVRIECPNAKSRQLVAQAIRWLPTYSTQVKQVFAGNDDSLTVTFKPKVTTLLGQQIQTPDVMAARTFFSDLEYVLTEVAVWQDNQTPSSPVAPISPAPENNGESGMFVDPEAEQPTTTVAIQETIKKVDAKTLLFAGLIIAAIILVIKK